MVVITVTPDWARLLDFETTAPEAVEKLARERAAGEPRQLSTDVARRCRGPLRVSV